MKKGPHLRMYMVVNTSNTNVGVSQVFVSQCILKYLYVRKGGVDDWTFDHINQLA